MTKKEIIYTRIHIKKMCICFIHKWRVTVLSSLGLSRRVLLWVWKWCPFATIHRLLCNIADLFKHCLFLPLRSLININKNQFHWKKKKKKAYLFSLNERKILVNFIAVSFLKIKSGIEKQCLTPLKFRMPFLVKHMHDTPCNSFC